MTVVVVGAGIAGLRVASALPDAVVLEARAEPGGRVRTAYAPDGSVAYEAGPWRVPADHRRVRALFAEHGLPLVPLATPTPPAARPPRVRPGLSTWDAHALDFADPASADLADLATGYADQTPAASGSAPYTTKSRDFYVCPQGFSALVARMATRADVRYDHRVADVAVEEDGRYAVRVVRRRAARTFSTTVLRCDALFVCVPPAVAREWSALRAHARSTLCAVTEGALCHVYVRHALPRGTPPFHHKTPSSLLAQTIASQYDNAWFQASYAGGRVAQLWSHLRAHSVAAFWAALRAVLRATHGIAVPSDAEHRMHYWPCAYHLWRPVPRFDLARAVARAVEPNPAALPRVYFAGEAFSSHQAWMEGALETADLALQRHRTGGTLPASEQETRVDGCAVDVARWEASHPGGSAPLRAHAGEDLGVYMRHVGHSDEAWAVAHALKR